MTARIPLSVEVALDTLRAGRPVHTPLKRAHTLTEHLSEAELARLSLAPSSVNATSGLWVSMRVGDVQPS